MVKPDTENQTVKTPRSRWHAVALIVILSGAFALRVSGISWGFIFDRKWQYVSVIQDDERNQLRAISQMNPRRLDFNPDDSSEGSLFAYVGAASLLASERVGYVHLSSNDVFYREHPGEMSKLYIVLRFVSMVFGVAEIAAVFFVGSRFFSPGVGLLAAIFIAIAPMEVVQSTYARSHTIANLLFIASIYAALRIAEGDRRTRTLALGGLAIGAACATRFSMAPAVLLLPAAEALAAYRKGMRGWGVVAATFGRRTFTAAALVLGGLAIANPYLVMHPVQWYAQMATQHIGYSGSMFDMATRLANMAVGIFHSFPLAVGWTIAIAATSGLLLLARRRHALPMLFLVFLAPYAYLILSGSLSVIPRFTMPFIPFAALFAAYGVWAAWGCVGKLSGRIIVAILATLIVAYPVLYDVAYLKTARREHPISQLATWIDQNIPADATIGVSKKSVHYKDINFEKYTNVIELDGYFSDLKNTARPEYIVLFRSVSNFAYPQSEWEDQHARIRQHGYREAMYARNDISIFGIQFHERVSDQLEHEAYVYRRTGLRS